MKVFPVILIIVLLTIQKGVTLGPESGDSAAISHDPNDIHFYLFSSSSDLNERNEIVYNDQNSLKTSPFKIGIRTIFLIHGFLGDVDAIFPAVLRNEYVKSTLNYNYIVVDWGLLARNKYTTSLISPASYTNIILMNIPIVARRVADFVQFLNQKKYTDLESIHFIGHSLGAHISGMAGYLIKQDNKGRMVSRISGLDPALPGFFGIEAQRTLRPEDANFVDAYHTSMGTAGTMKIVGHVDFYPNGGIMQSSCINKKKPSFDDLRKLLNVYTTTNCNHGFVITLYAATLSKNFTACQCNPFELRSSNLDRCMEKCPNPVLVGEPCPSSARGQYYFETSSNL